MAVLEDLFFKGKRGENIEELFFFFFISLIESFCVGVFKLRIFFL